MPQDSEAALAAIFEERAENLSRDELRRWSGETDRDRGLLAKLKGPGAKLLSGPRGSGKSTLLRKR
jgi:predicted AAA+ superfamily ATPase